MKRKLAVIALCILTFSKLSIAQPILNSNDLPHANDTFRLSTAQLPAVFTIDVTSTGPSYTWDYTQLEPASQRVDSFLDESATNPLFNIVFIDNAFNPNRSNQATAGQGFSLGSFISLSEVYNFYYNSSANYTQTGLGAAVNGIPLPIAYSPHDIIYRFPLEFGDTDSSASGYVVDLTSTLGIYYKVNKNRTNEVDGWGTLNTPFGTFQTLRVHSTLVQQDSIYLDTLGVGINFPPITSHEYKWLAATHGVPLLQINTAGTGTITQVVYRDSVQSLVGISDLNVIQKSLKVYPNPASDLAVLNYVLENHSSVQIDLISVDGKIISHFDPEMQTPGKHDLVFDLGQKQIPSGNYFIRLTVDGNPFLQKLVVSKK